MHGSGDGPRPDHLGDWEAFQQLINRQLRKLLVEVHPPHRGPYTMSEISERAAQLGYQVSSNYLYELRRGDRDNPTLKSLFAISAVFEVPMAYFFDDRDGVQAQTDLALARALNDPTVRDIALRSAAMDPKTRESATAVMEELQQLENRMSAGPSGAVVSHPARRNGSGRRANTRTAGDTSPRSETA